MAIGDKWRKWKASGEHFAATRQRHPRVLSAEQQALKDLRAANLAKLKAERAARIRAKRAAKVKLKRAAKTAAQRADLQAFHAEARRRQGDT